MRIVNLTRDRLAEVTQVFVEALGSTIDKPVDDALYAYFEDDRSFVAIDDDDRVVGFAGGFTTTIVAPGGRTVAGGGVPWIGVRVDEQGSGVGRELVAHQVRDAAGRGDAFLALNSSQYPIYGRWGYGPTGVWWSAKLDPRRVAWLDTAPEPGRVRVLASDDAADDLRDLYARSFGAWPGEVDRHDGYWPRRLQAPQEEGKRKLWALHHAADGTVDAAASYRTKEVFDETGFANELEVDDLFGVDEVAQARLVRWLVGIRLLGKVSFWRLDPGAAWPTMLRDPRLLVTTERTDTTWVRVLDAPRVLTARAAHAPGRVVLRVRDDLVPDNDGGVALEAVDGRLRCERTDEAPALTVDVRHVGSLAWAHTTATTLAAAGQLLGADGTAPAAADDLARLDHLLAWPRPAWSSTMF